MTFKSFKTIYKRHFDMGGGGVFWGPTLGPLEKHKCQGPVQLWGFNTLTPPPPHFEPWFRVSIDVVVCCAMVGYFEEIGKTSEIITRSYVPVLPTPGPPITMTLSSPSQSSLSSCSRSLPHPALFIHHMTTPYTTRQRLLRNKPRLPDSNPLYWIGTIWQIWTLPVRYRY